MASLLFGFHFLQFLHISADGGYNHSISLGSSLVAGAQPADAWYSAAKLFAFGFYPQGTGYVVAIWLLGFEEENSVVWTAYRDDPPVSPNATLELTHKGELVLGSEQGGVQKTIATNISLAVMNNNGNFMLYDDHMGVVWQSFDYPTDSMLQGQSLFSGSELVSSVSKTNYSSGRFRIKMQMDGNLVMYPINTEDNGLNSYWATNTYDLEMGTSKSYLFLNNTGLLLINDNSDVTRYLYYDALPPVIYRAALGNDGIFRLYTYNLTKSLPSVVWKNPDDPCDVKSFCGPNSYCTMNDEQPDCVCLPGSKFVDLDWKYSGCERNFTKARCESGKENMTYYGMVGIEQVVLGDHPYHVATYENKENCSKSCLEDCDCDAALFQRGSCSKHKFPLRYVKRAYDVETYMSFSSRL